MRRVLIHLGSVASTVLLSTATCLFMIEHHYNPGVALFTSVILTALPFWTAIKYEYKG
jgi:hypothetical protein